MQQRPGAVVNAVAQGAEMAGVRIIPSDGADAGHALFQKDPQFGPVRGDLGMQGQPVGLPLPPDHHFDLPAGAGQRIAHILGAVYGFIIDGNDLVADLQPAFAGGVHGVVKSSHDHAVIFQFQPDHLPTGHQIIHSQRMDGDSGKNKQYGQQPNCRFFHIVSPLLFCLPF